MEEEEYQHRMEPISHTHDNWDIEETQIRTHIGNTTHIHMHVRTYARLAMYVCIL